MRSTIRHFQAYCCALLMASFILFSPIKAYASEMISLQQAIEIVQDQYGGKVLQAKMKKGYYQVKLLTDSGRVKLIEVDAQSGTILSPKKK